MIKKGLKYNVCSILQLKLIAPFAYANKIQLSFRVHPGVGSGESATRNIGDKYSCFGIHLSDISDNKVIIHLLGGNLTIEWQGKNHPVYTENDFIGK